MPQSAPLLLLSTERQVYAFDISRRSGVTIGRHESNDLQLASRTVSNFHAEIVKDGDGLQIRDLGSTNGTRVNQQSVEASPVGPGDSIRIGNHVMTIELKPASGSDNLADAEQKSPSILAPGTAGRIISLRGRSADAMKTIRGMDPNDFTFPDLLKLLSSSSEPVQVKLSRNHEVAHIYTRRQALVHAEYGGAIGEKALYRLFGWQGGNYEVHALADSQSIPQTIALPMETLIMEGMAHSVELGRLIATLPPMEAPLCLKENCPLPLTAHTPDEIEMFQLIIRHETIAKVLEQSALADIRALRLIDSLLRKGVFETAPRTDVSLDGTLFNVPPRHNA